MENVPNLLMCNTSESLGGNQKNSIIYDEMVMMRRVYTVDLRGWTPFRRHPTSFPHRNGRNAPPSSTRYSAFVVPIRPVARDADSRSQDLVRPQWLRGL